MRQFDELQLPRKDSQGVPPLAGQDCFSPVPQTDTGGLVEKTKVSERRKFKELGKKSGRKLCKMSCFAQQLPTSNFQWPTLWLVVGGWRLVVAKAKPQQKIVKGLFN